MLGKTMRVKDGIMGTYFECATDVPMDEVEQILQGDPRTAKARLAREITALYHGEEAANQAEEEFNRVFAQKELPSDMPKVTASNALLLDVLQEQGMIASKSEGRRLLEQNAIKRDDEPVTDVESLAEPGIYKIGKRKFLNITPA